MKEITFKSVASERDWLTIGKRVVKAVMLEKAVKITIEGQCKGIEFFPQKHFSIQHNVETFLALVSQYHQRRQVDWEESPAGKRANDESKQKEIRLNREMGEAMNELPKLDFTDPGSLLNWLMRAVDWLDYADVAKSHRINAFKTIVAIFGHHGFRSMSDECKDTNNREILAKWIIESWLHSFANGNVGPHSIYYYAEDWHKKFRR